MTSAAFGKVILLGEHAVVHGHPALAAALDRGVAIRLATGAGGRGPLRLRVPAWDLACAAGDGSPVGTALAAIAEAVGGDHAGAELEADAALPPAAGLGSSAALAVALVRALAARAGRAVDDGEAVELAQRGERVFHANPSGVDVTLAARGGVGEFTRAGGFVALDAPPLALAIGLSGEPRSTGAMVAKVQAALDAGGDAGARLARLGAAARDGARALAGGDLARLGALFAAAHAELAALGVSSPGLDRLVATARQTGALGAKLTGAGGGGAVIALAPGREASVVEAWRALGFQGFVALAGPAAGGRA